LKQPLINYTIRKNLKDMQNIPILPIIVIGGIMITELILNKTFANSKKYLIIKHFVFFTLAGIITVLAIISGDKQQINQAFLFDIIILVAMFSKKFNFSKKKNNEI
jgi:hypothetical protein